MRWAGIPGGISQSRAKTHGALASAHEAGGSRPLIRIAAVSASQTSARCALSPAMEGVTTRGAVGALSESGELAPGEGREVGAQRVRDVSSTVTLDVSKPRRSSASIS